MTNIYGILNEIKLGEYYELRDYLLQYKNGKVSWKDHTGPIYIKTDDGCVFYAVITEMWVDIDNRVYINSKAVDMKYGYKNRDLFDEVNVGDITQILKLIRG